MSSFLKKIFLHRTKKFNKEAKKDKQLWNKYRRVLGRKHGEKIFSRYKKITQKPSLNLSSTGTLLGLILSIITIGQVSTWLFSSSQVARDQSHVEFVDLLVSQAYEARLNPKNPLCIFYRNEHILTYVFCDTQQLVAQDEFDNRTGEKLLVVRKFFDEDGKEILAFDRYEYSNTSELIQKNRVIFQSYLSIVKCAYIQTTYDHGEILVENRFHGSCGAGMVETPAYPEMKFAAPPPIILFMPYR